MLLPIKPFRAPKPRRDGLCAIRILYCHAGNKKTELPTGIAIPPNCWEENRKKKSWTILPDLPEECGSAEKLQKNLVRMLRVAEDIVSYARKKKIKDIIAFLNQHYDPKLDSVSLEDELKKVEANQSGKKNIPIAELSFFREFQDYIKTKTPTVSESMPKVYKVVKSRLLAFQTHRKEAITFESFDLEFYEAFVHYLTYDHVQVRRTKIVRGLKRSTIGTTIKQLRIFLIDRIRRKIIPPIDLTGYKILDEESDAIYLSEREITKIYELDLSNYPYLEKYRYLLVLGCLTGLRFSDFSKLKPEDIRQRTLYKKQQKSKHWVVIPLKDRANYILHNIFKKKVPIVLEKDFNKYVKIIGKLAGITELIKFSYQKGNSMIEEVKLKCEWISSHTCRRSFCTNEFLAGTPTELIMKISGHKSLRDFLKYIRVTPEEASLLIRNLWIQRGDIQVA